MTPPRLHHTGIAVADLARSVDFYRRMFGVEAQVQPSPMTDDAGQHGLEQAVYRRAMLAFGPSQVELVEYTVPADAAKAPRRSVDAGSCHIAFVVEDVDATIAELAARGMTLLGAPVRVAEGPAAGLVIGFGQDPDGNRIEFLQAP